MASGQGTTSMTDLLKKLFQAVALPWDANTNLYISLHTATPTATGIQTTNEASYTGYARQAVARTNVGWSVSAATVSNLGNITFPTNTGGSQTITSVGIGTASSGAGELIAYGDLTSSVTLATGDSLQFNAGALALTES